MEPTPAKRFIADKYEVLGILGEGGTGVVYDARTRDGQAIALKVMHQALAGDRQIRGRFQREAAILRRLDGAHVCPIVDFGEVPGADATGTVLYIALPKIEGESLAALLERGMLDVDRALDLMLEILSALTSAHVQGVIHRDLKPANVLLATKMDGHGSLRAVTNGTKVIVVDFGLSKIITGAGVGTTNLTTHNMLFGTPEYMSPEQARGDELDPRCDVYAAGVMLYEMLTGERPFSGDTPLNVLTAHLTSDLVPPSTRAHAGGRVTPALEAVCVHALARERERRYASAEAFAAAIRHARVHPDDVAAVRPEALAAPPVVTDPFSATIREGGAVDVTGPTLIGKVIAASVPPPVRVSARPSPPVVPSRPPPRRPETRAIWVTVWLVVGLASVAAGVWFAMRN